MSCLYPQSHITSVHIEKGLGRLENIFYDVAKLKRNYYVNFLKIVKYVAPSDHGVYTLISPNILLPKAANLFSGSRGLPQNQELAMFQISDEVKTFENERYLVNHRYVCFDFFV